MVFPVVLWLLVAPSAAQIRFEDFSSPNSANNLVFNGNSRISTWQSQVVLRLTDGTANTPETATTYFKSAQTVTLGFTTYFKFQIHNPTTCCAPGDGFAFIIQNSNQTSQLMGASGSGLTALGAGNGGLGYSGINNSVAVEFDILDNPWDPNSNHTAVQSCGTQFNTPVHLPGDYTLGNDHNVTSCLLNQAINTSIGMLGGTCSDSSCSDGTPHEVVIEYTAPSNHNQQQGLLQIWLDPQFIPGTHTPIAGAPTVVSTPFDISSISPDQNGAAWVGFAASQPADGTAQDILAWEFTQHGPSQITQTIASGGNETMFPFGEHQALVTYPTDFQNTGNITMTVLATPTNQATFYTQRLMGTQFANETCVIYLGTGGQCMVYSVTCHDPNGNQVTCPMHEDGQGDGDIAICSQFKIANTNSVNNPDFLEADPIGSNNWTSIFSAFEPSDPVVSGRGRGFSDLVATFIMAPTPHRRAELLRRKSLDRIIRTPTHFRVGGSGLCPPVD